MDALALLGYGFSFLLGLAGGSFLNVAIYRYNTGASFLDRSRCLSCNTVLAWPELLPVVSFLFRRGRCRVCGSRISWQYPAVELLTGIVFALIFYRFGLQPFTLVYYWTISSLLIVIAGYDLRHQIIPNPLVYAFAALSVLSPVVLGVSDWSFSAVAVRLAHNLISGGIFYFLFWSVWYYSAGRWIGLGDGKLAAGIGFLLGFADGLSAIILGFWLGALTALLLIGFKRYAGGWLPVWLKRLKINLKTEIAFAPFLIVALFITLITGFNVIPL